MVAKTRLEKLGARGRRRLRWRARGAAGGVERARVPHVARPVLSAGRPLHVVYRMLDDISWLRPAELHEAIKRALRACCARPEVRICHYALQDDRLHLIVEASDKEALSRGMQGFGISASKQINRRLGRRKGQVFAERYECRIIEDPKQMRNTLISVLDPGRTQGADGDSLSSAAYFDGWSHRRPSATPMPRGGVSGKSRPHEFDRLTPDTTPDERPLVATPETRLLARAWRRYGLIQPTETAS